MMTTATAVTEYMLAEIADGRVQVLPHCGSWYSDRYYTNDHPGDIAVWYALDRVQHQAGGTYTVVAVREFMRGPDGVQTPRSARSPWQVERPAAAAPVAHPGRIAELRGRVAATVGRVAFTARSANPIARAAAVAFAVGAWLVLLAVSPAWQVVEFVVRFAVTAVTF